MKIALNRIFRHRIVMLLCCVTLAASAPSAYSAESASAIHVAGAVAEPSDWTAARMEKEFAADLQTVAFSSKGAKHSAKCVALITFLERAGMQTNLKMKPVDPKTKNFPLRMVVVIAGRDGYTAAFSLGELLPDIGHEDAWLAIEVDGQPLPDAEGPARLIVPGDIKPARWVREVGAISVLDGAAATTQPK